MSDFLHMIFLLIFLWFLYGFYGFLLCKSWKLSCPAMLWPLTGYELCMVLFQIVELPAHLLGAPLSLTAYVYVIVLAGFACFLIRTAPIGMPVSRPDRAEIVCAGFVAAVPVMIQFFNMVYGSMADTGQYIGQISTALYTDTIRQYEPFSGRASGYFDSQNLFAAYEMHSAVICRIFHMHPLIYVHHVLAVMEIVFSVFLVYQSALLLFAGDRRKSQTALVVSLFVNLFSYSPYTWSGFLFLRTAESKSMLAAVVLPLLFYDMAVLSEDSDAKAGRKALFLTVVFGLGICRSSAFLIPAALTMQLLPLIISDRKWKLLPVYGLCMAPCVVILGYQMLIRKAG